jgi:hypothetical protein
MSRRSWIVKYPCPGCEGPQGRKAFLGPTDRPCPARCEHGWTTKICATIAEFHEFASKLEDKSAPGYFSR